MGLTNQRVDQVLVARGLAPTRSAAQRLIQAGAVWVNSSEQSPALVKKAGLLVEPDVNIAISDDAELRYVSRAGLKLECAVQAFAIPVAGRVCLDVGQSTGGFTDCLMRLGAIAVIGVDVGHSQLHQSLQGNSNIECFEHLNIRDAEAIVLLGQRAVARGQADAMFDLIVVDVSFVSLLKVLPSVKQLARVGGDCIALFKPQFEVGRQHLNKAGVVRDQAAIAQARENFGNALADVGFAVLATCVSPICGSDGNSEFLYHLKCI